MKNKRSGTKTLLLSIIMSSPGPIICGLALIQCKSSTQIADFVRRTAEFLAIVVSFIVFTISINNSDYNLDKRKSLENHSNVFVGLIMCLAGLIMGVIALTSKNKDDGNVIPGLAISIISLSGNIVFWYKYRKLNKLEKNSILQVQLRLYRAKTLVDLSVVGTLSSILIIQNTSITHTIDKIGSILVACYLIWNGLRTTREVLKNGKRINP